MRKPSQEILNNLAVNVRRSRLKKGLSQERLAEFCGFHRTYIGSVERGERNVTLSTLEILSKTLELTISQLLEK